MPYELLALPTSSQVPYELLAFFYFFLIFISGFISEDRQFFELPDSLYISGRCFLLAIFLATVGISLESQTHNMIAGWGSFNTFISDYISKDSQFFGQPDSEYDFRVIFFY